MDSHYAASLVLIATGSLALVWLYWERNNSKSKGQQDDEPIQMRPEFKLWLLGYGNILLGVITLIMKLIGQL